VRYDEDMTLPGSNARQPVTVTMNPQGRIVIPAEVRRQLAWEPGETLLLRLDPESNGIVLATPRSGRDQLRERFAHLRRTDGTRVSDDLIAERRFEAAIEGLDQVTQRRLRRARDA
jgi:AbrB family looped-hinge helix DNA binding protein